MLLRASEIKSPGFRGTLSEKMALFFTIRTFLILRRHDRFSEYVKMRFMRGKTQHDQIRIHAIDAMTGIGIESWLATLAANEVENFVLAFTWCITVGKNDFQMFE